MPIDERLFILINGEWTSPVTDWWAAIVRATELWVIPGVITLAAALLLGRARVRVTALLAFVVLVAGDGVLVRPMKLIIQRPAPDQMLAVRSVRLARVEPRIRALGLPLEIESHGPRERERGRRSFPSGHAWNAFAVATVIAAWWRRWGLLAFLPALAIAHARVAAGVHWPSDVLFSGLLAIPATLGLLLAIQAAWARLQPRLARRWTWAARWPSLLPWRAEPT